MIIGSEKEIVVKKKIVMNVTYRTDWLSPHDPHQLAVDVMHYGPDLKNAKAMARKMSKITGSAYVIRSLNGKDVAHILHTDGHAVGDWTNP
jgi:hypothetical protein